MFKSAFEGYIHRVISIKEDFNLYLDLERDEFKSVDRYFSSICQGNNK